jgi:hypothetical protein
MRYSTYLFKDLAGALKENPDLIDIVFGFTFKRVPHYDELLNFTAPIHPVFSIDQIIAAKYKSGTKENDKGNGSNKGN